MTSFNVCTSLYFLKTLEKQVKDEQQLALAFFAVTLPLKEESSSSLLKLISTFGLLLRVLF
ncbi:MAG: hypothetical protein WBD50_05700 [Candidatus Rhabdochlamydia sp.]